MTKMSVEGARFESTCDRKERAREGKSNARVNQQGFLGTHTQQSCYSSHTLCEYILNAAFFSSEH